MSTDLTRLSAAELAEQIHRREVSSVEVTRAHLERIGAVDERVRAFLHIDGVSALAAAGAVDAALDAGEQPSSALAGVPLALKDVFTTTDMPTTCGSRMLEGWWPPYDATVTTRLRAAGIPVLGKTNMDEFAMGSSTENSAYGPTHNPWDLERIPGGSGGGSAAALAAFEAPQADLRQRLPLRPRRLCVLAGPGRTLRAGRAGHRPAARGAGRARSAGLHLGGCAGASGGGRRPRGCAR